MIQQALYGYPKNYVEEMTYLTAFFLGFTSASALATDSAFLSCLGTISSNGSQRT